MAKITLKDITSGDYAYATVLKDNFDSIDNALDGMIDNSNISPTAQIDPSKIADGGAVTQTEVTLTGEAGKIPRIDANGNLNVVKIVFVAGV